MLTVKVNRGTVHPYSEDGAFYTVQMKRDPKSLLSKFLNDDIIKASEMLNEFREEVKKAVEPLKNTCKYWVQLMTRVRGGHPNDSITHGYTHLGLRSMICFIYLYNQIIT